MKKSKLLLASPLLIAPIAAIVPLTTTSCHKNKTNFGKLEEYINYEIITEGESAFIYLTIKDSTRYLPNQLTSVSTNGKKLIPLIEANGRQDYYEYYTFDNNQTAVIYIYEYQGTVQVEAETATVKELTAEGYDITGSKVAEFEIGEYFNVLYTSQRISAKLTLSNDDVIELDPDSFDIKLGTMEEGAKFEDEKAETTGSIKYGDKTANFKFKVIKKTQAYYSYKESEWAETQKVTKYSDWTGALTAYNDATTKGCYSIGLAAGEYTVTNPIVLAQKNGFDLTFGAYDEPYFNGTRTVYPVVIKNSTASSSTFSITNTNNYTDSSVEIYGVEINTADNISQVSLGNSTNNIWFTECYFYNTDTTKTTKGIKCDAAQGSEAPQNVYVLDCDGRNLDILFDSMISHNQDTTYDFIVGSCSLWDCKQMFKVSGADTSAYISNNFAQLMSNDSPNSGIIIGGNGDYYFADNEFIQGKTVASGDTKGFIEISSGYTAGNRNLYFDHCALVTLDTPGGIVDVYNSIGSGTPGVDWNISWYGFDGELQTGKVYSNPESAAGQSNVWTHK